MRETQKEFRVQLRVKYLGNEILRQIKKNKKQCRAKLTTSFIIVVIINERYPVQQSLISKIARNHNAKCCGFFP